MNNKYNTDYRNCKNYRNINSLNKINLENFNNCENIVFAGGGMLGIGFTGILKYIDEHKIYDKIKNILSVSAGSLFGLFLLLNYRYDEVEDVIITINCDKCCDINLDSFLSLHDTKGLTDCEYLYNYVKDVINRKTNNPDITLSEVYKLYGKSFLVGVTNITKDRYEILCHNTHPDLKLVDAIRMSISLPIIYEPILLDGDLYIDGGVIDSFPIDFFDPTSNNFNYLYMDDIRQLYVEKLDDIESNDSSQPESNDSSQPESNDSSQPESNDSSRTESNDSSQPESNDSSQPESNDSSQPESNDSSQPESTTLKKKYVLKKLLGFL